MKKPESKKPAKKTKSTPEETAIEVRRQELYQELDDADAGWKDQYIPGTFGCHELLDRTAFLADSVEQLLHDHPACVQNPEWFACADKRRWP